MTAIFAVHNVVCSRNNHPLFSAVNLTLTEGQMLHVRGENGIGKTTLLRTLAGLSTPLSGDICWLEKPILDNDAFRQALFYLGHKIAIKSALTVAENILYTFSAKKCEAKIKQILGLMGLDSKQDRLASTLSSGQRQRLAIAKLLLSEATLWILDEPFTALDQQGFELVESLMLAHLTRRGIIIFTSHHPLTSKLGAFYRELQLRPIAVADHSQEALQ